MKIGAFSFLLMIIISNGYGQSYISTTSTSPGNITITHPGSINLAGTVTTLALGNGIFFNQSGNASDGLPYSRFNENYGIRFGSPNSIWVLSTKTSFLAGFQPAGEDWGTGNIYASNKLSIGTTSLLNGLTIFKSGDFNGGSIRFGHSGSYDGVSSFGYNSATGRDALKFSYFPHNSTSGQVDLVTLDVNGNFGIGTTSPTAKLEVSGSGTSIFRNKDFSTSGYVDGAVNIFRYNNDNANVNTVLNLGNYYNNNSSVSDILAIDFRSGDSGGLYGGPATPAGRIKVQTAWVPAFMDFDLAGSTVMHLQNGNVGIGNTNPDAKLAVSGQVHAQEVKVSVTVPGPDYVFEKDYKLSSLEDIKTYIDQNKHLPEVPSAKEMEKNGVQLGEMNMILLKKVEELTLYMIELKKENNDLKSRIETIENKK